MKVVCSAVVLAFVTMACSSSSSSSGAVTSAGSSNLAQACADARTRANACAPDAGKSPAAVGDADCAQINDCYGAMFRAGVAEEVAACVAKRRCTEGYGSCVNDAARAHAQDADVPDFLTKCYAKRDACNTSQNTYLSSDDCRRYALIVNRSGFAACVEKACDQIGRCLSDLGPACTS